MSALGQKRTSLSASGCLLELGGAHRRYNDRFSELQLQTCRPVCVFSARLCWLVLDSCPLATGGINLSAVSFPPAFGQGSSRRINTRATSGATSSTFFTSPRLLIRIVVASLAA